MGAAGARGVDSIDGSPDRITVVHEQERHMRCQRPMQQEVGLRQPVRDLAVQRFAQVDLQRRSRHVKLAERVVDPSLPNQIDKSVGRYREVVDEKGHGSSQSLFPPRVRRSQPKL